MDPASPPTLTSGGITQFFVRYRVLGWFAMAGVLVWGWLALQRLPQQEDPAFPTHDAVLVTVFPLARAARIDEEVSATLEAALSELPTLGKLQSRSKDNLSTIVITLKADHKEAIEQELLSVPSAGRVRQFGHQPEAILSFKDMAAAAYSVRTLYREETGPLQPSTSVLIAVLRGQKGFDSITGSHPLHRLVPFYKSAPQFALHRPLGTILVAYGLLAASTALIPLFGRQFFPAAERNQLLIDIQLPEGSGIAQTLAVIGRVSDFLQQEDAIQSAVVVSGGGTPMFYYNVLPRQSAANAAEVLVNTRRADDVPALIVRLRAVLATVFATVCGLIPLAVTGGELWRPLTAVHIFGLLFGTLLALLLLPVLYFQFAKWRWIK